MNRLVIGLKLLLLGYSDNAASAASGEPWPVTLPGEGVISSRKIGDYLDEEFWHYYRIYTNCASCGLPHGKGWLNEPPWVIQLISQFENTIEQVRNWNIRKGKEWHS